MNVTFHVLAGLATAALLCNGDMECPRERGARPWQAGLAGCVTGIGIHGLLDWLPHAYPIPSVVDVILALCVVSVAVGCAQRRHRLLVLASFLGAVLPDVVDLAPQLMNRHMGTALPVVRVFPWHWPAYSGSLYDGSRALESAVHHVWVVGASIGILVLRRRAI